MNMPAPTPLSPSSFSAAAEPSESAVLARFSGALDALRAHHDRFFGWLLLAQWIASILLALIVSPRSWAGATSQTHVHVWAALFLGGAISLFPAWLGWKHPGRAETRHAIAAGQMLMSALLIHLTGGRLETHFHVFGSLAFLAFYRDVRVLATATVIVCVDHLLRGIFWPQSVYGVLVATPWRSAEHAFWVLFEVFFLTLSIRRGLGEMREVARRQLTLEGVNDRMETAVRDRTQALVESESRFRALFQHNPIGLYRAAPDGRLQLANPAMLKILGYASEEEMRAAGERLQGRKPEAGRRDFFCDVLEKGAVEGRDTTWVRRDGTQVTTHESARAVCAADGALQHIDGSAEDVTGHRQLEERYQQAQKVQAIGQLAGGIAHDFNNMLTVISGFADLALSKPHLPEDIHRYVTEVRKASEQAGSLTQQMLAFSRKQTLRLRVLKLNHLVAELERMLRRLVGEHIRIETRLAADLAPVKVDPGQMQQVILNLVVNARDAMPEGGSVILETANIRLDEAYARMNPGLKPGDYVLLSVSDTGCGMTPEVRVHLFEPFFTTKGPGAGTGLGLATSHGIVTQCGGHISVYSEVGLGSTFKVFLPAAREALDPIPTLPAPATTGGGDETVLLVEDEPQIREFASEVLTGRGYRVLTAANGREALRRFTEPGQSPVAIIVTDVVMPEMGGRDLVRRARELVPDLPVILTSGFTFDAIQPADPPERGVHFISKPYAMTQLAEKVREVLDARATP